MIDVQDLRFRYPGASTDAIRGLTLRIAPGSLFGLLGPNGSGKTTLISLLTGLIPAASGTLRIDGRSLPGSLRTIQRCSACVPQDYAFYQRLTVRENLRFFAGAAGLFGTRRKRRIDEVMAIAELRPFNLVRASRLSGGLKRRLNLAIGLLNEPTLLFLDEPTVGIDPQSRRFILDAIRQINAGGTTVIYTTHYMEEVEQLCEDIAILDEGRLLAHGPLATLLGGASGQQLEVAVDANFDPEQHREFEMIDGLKISDRTLQVANADITTLKQLVGVADKVGIGINRLKYGYGNLEELFLHLTGRSLRD